MSDQRLIADLIYSTQFKDFYDLTNDEVDALVTEIERLRGAVSFARSVIKSGEPWTETCEQILCTSPSPNCGVCGDDPHECAKVPVSQCPGRDTSPTRAPESGQK